MKKYLLLASVLFCVNSFALSDEEVVVWNGGISIEERENAPAIGTKLVFFTQSGSLVSDVKVLIKDSAGNEVLDMMTQGPWLILKLPKGRYSVLAQWQEAEPQGSNIDVDESRQVFGYMFRPE